MQKRPGKGWGGGGGGVGGRKRKRNLGKSTFKEVPNLFTVSKRLNQLNTQETAIG